MNEKKVMMGSMPTSWRESEAKSITFSVTEDCNLVCKYCYMVGKNSKNKMDFETAKKTVDYILSNTELFNEPAVIWEFIGGEPLLEIELIDKICDYIKRQMFILNHTWFNNYMINISTNGLLYRDQRVQEFLLKNRSHISIGISIDGNKIKHDLQRVKHDGSGSYEDVMKSVPLWLEQFPNAMTKATFSHDDLPYLKDSVVSLWNNGIKTVSANIIFEDVWKEGDDKIFESQLRGLADYIIENKLWDDYSVRFFSPRMGVKLSKDDLKKNFCGAGRMLAVDYKGTFFPCIRFLDFALNNKKSYEVGDFKDGINHDKLRPFKVLSCESQSSEECINCEVATECGWCTGANYDFSNNGTIFQRATNICKMHKANVRATDYFWDRYSEVTGKISPREDYKKSRNKLQTEEKYLNIIISDDITPHCGYITKKYFKSESRTIENSLIEKALNFASQNNYIPTIIGYNEKLNLPLELIYFVDNSCKFNDIPIIRIFDDESEINSNWNDNTIVSIRRNSINKLYNIIEKIHMNTSRINISIQDISDWDQDDINLYKQELEKVIVLVEKMYLNDNPIEINVLTDIYDLQSMCNCDSGNSITLAPNGKFYVCPAFYFNDPNDSVGDIDSGINLKNKYLFYLDKSPICMECDVYNCKKCKFLCKKLTNEVNIPGKIQCIISHEERAIALKLQKRLIANGYTFENILDEKNYNDPIVKIK